VTAYFESARQPGRVLRVSRITAFPVARACMTRERVAVAMPERKEMKLRLVRSPDRRETALPLTSATRCPFSRKAPSCSAKRTRTSGSIARKTAAKTSSPASTPVSLLHSVAARSPSGATACDVTSPESPRSSRSAIWRSGR
jgi:hypothetical protein